MNLGLDFEFLAGILRFFYSQAQWEPYHFLWLPPMQMLTAHWLGFPCWCCGCVKMHVTHIWCKAHPYSLICYPRFSVFSWSDLEGCKNYVWHVFARICTLAVKLWSCAFLDLHIPVTCRNWQPRCDFKIVKHPTSPREALAPLPQKPVVLEHWKVLGTSYQISRSPLV